MQVHATREAQPAAAANAAQALGVLYVDSRFASRDISGVSQDILHAIATEAASLIENARLVQAEEEARRYQQEFEHRGQHPATADAGKNSRSTVRSVARKESVL